MCTCQGVTGRHARTARHDADRNAWALRRASRDFSGLLNPRRRVSNQSVECQPINPMKTSLLVLSVIFTLALGASSRSDEAAKTTATPTPNPNLKRDSERLQQATANAAKAREQAATASPAATATP